MTFEREEIDQASPHLNAFLEIWKAAIQVQKKPLSSLPPSMGERLVPGPSYN